MPNGKKTATRRVKGSSFDRALTDAKARLADANKERAEAQTRITLLSIEIPTLEQTIRALTSQLNPGVQLSPNPIPAAPVTMPFVVAHRATGTHDGIGTRIEIDDSMSSIPVRGNPFENHVEEVVEDVNTPPDLDSLPGIGGSGFA